MSEELKPCPCCGGTAYVSEGYTTNEGAWPHGKFYRVYCGSCQLRQLFHLSAMLATRAWNRRASGDGGKSEAELEALRRDAERYRFLRDRMGFSQAPGKEATMSMTQYIEAPRHDFHNDWLGERFDASVDQAIDDAIAAKKEKGE